MHWTVRRTAAVSMLALAGVSLFPELLGLRPTGWLLLLHVVTLVLVVVGGVCYWVRPDTPDNFGQPGQGGLFDDLVNLRRRR